MLLKYAAKTGRRIDLSIGASTDDEIKKSLKILNKYSKNINVWLMYGYQLFPTQPNKLNLNIAKYYRKKFQLRIGYQDHSTGLDGYTIPTISLGAGFDIIEKHITDDLKRKGTDSESAINSEDLKNFVKVCHNAYKALGFAKKKILSREEKKYRKYCKKNIFINKDFKKGERIELNNIILLRSDKKGIFADKIEYVINKRLKKNKKKGSQLFKNEII